MRLCLEKQAEKESVFLAGLLLFAGALVLFRGLTGRLLKYSGCGRKPGFKIPWILLAAAAAGFFYFHLAETVHDPLESYAGRTAEIQGRVLSVQEKEGYAKLELQRESARLRGKNGEILVFSGKEKMLLHLSGEPEGLYFKGLENGEANWQSLCGRDIRLTGKLSLPSEQQNPGCFNYRSYLKTRNIRTVISGVTSHLEIQGRGSRFWNETAKLRYTFSNNLKPFLGENSRALIMGMMFGDRSLLDEDLYEAFQKNGTAPILAVSGIHVGIVYGCVSGLRQRRSRKKAVKNPGFVLFLQELPGAAALFLYGALASFSPSVTRALFMIYLHMASRLLCRRYDLVTAASAAALFLLLRNPWQLFHCGFQLSFLAVFCLGFMLPRLDSWLAGCRNFQVENRENSFISLVFPGSAGGLYKFLRPAKWRHGVKFGVRICMPALAIQIGMFPFTAFLFNYISPLSFLINLPVALLAGLILPVGLVLLCLTELLNIVCFFYPFFRLALSLGITCLGLFSEVLLRLNSLFYQEGLTSFSVASPSPFFLGLYYGILFFYFSDSAWLWLKTGRGRRLAVFMVLVLLVSAVLPGALGSGQGQAELVFVSVGQGDCLHIRTPSGKNILIDGGGNSRYNVGKRTLLPYLLKNGVTRIDMVFLSHLHEDHYLGICQLTKVMEVAKIGLYEGNRNQERAILQQTGASASQLLYLSAGQRVALDEGVWVDVLWPTKEAAGNPAQPDDVNETGLLLRLSYDGVSVLMTGDLGKPEEAEILEWLENGGVFPEGTGVLRSDILKVGHHGSRNSTSDEFLKAVAPRAAVIQVGAGNRFGHPHGETVENLEKHGILIYRNDTQGAVLTDIHADGIFRVRTMLAEERSRKLHGGNQKQKECARISII